RRGAERARAVPCPRWPRRACRPAARHGVRRAQEACRRPRGPRPVSRQAPGGRLVAPPARQGARRRRRRRRRAPRVPARDHVRPGARRGAAARRGGARPARQRGRGLLPPRGRVAAPWRARAVAQSLPAHEAAARPVERAPPGGRPGDRRARAARARAGARADGAAARPAARRVARRAAAVGGAGIRRRRPGEPMYRGLSVIAVVPVLNEEGEIGRQLGASVLPMGRVAGVGAALRAGYRYGVDHGYDVVVVMAGNDKDAPEEIPLLLDPIADDRADFVQGSRFLKPRASFGAMPFYRRIATRVHPLLFSLAAQRWVTESTNGFRAVHRRVLTDPRLDLSPAWLDAYELEPFLYLRAIQLGYRTAEVPVTKVYPPRHLGQTKMKPLT